MSATIKFDFYKFIGGAFKEVGRGLVGQARRNMNKKSFGRVYIIGGKKHIASKYGDPPNNMTGALRDSIGYKVNFRELEFGSGSNSVMYSKYLENKEGLNRPNIKKSVFQRTYETHAIIKKRFEKSFRFKR